MVDEAIRHLISIIYPVICSHITLRSLLDTAKKFEQVVESFENHPQPTRETAES